MAYFLKKSNYKKGTYLQIYESFYDPERKGGAHRSFKALGYVHELQAKGIDDPISFYKEEVIRLNQEANAAKAAKKRSRFQMILRKTHWLFSDEKHQRQAVC
ncbi:MAG: hypothetical protein ACLTC8_01725 [Lachnospiraceae bacterium]